MVRALCSAERVEVVQEVEDRGGEGVVVVTGDHVAGVGNVDGSCVWDGGEEFLDGVGTDEVGHRAAD